MDLIVENVRCFVGRHVARLAPITVLVGENSSGKSTFLAMARAAWVAAGNCQPVDFNESPFTLGAFEDILSASAKVRHFTLGYRFSPTTRDNRRALSDAAKAEVTAKFVSRSGQPSFAEWRLTYGSYSISIRPANATEPGPAVTVESERASATLAVPPEFGLEGFGARSFLPVLPFVLRESRATGVPFAFRKRMGEFSEADTNLLQHLIAAVDLTFGRAVPYAGAPVRSEPLRIYSPISDKPTPNGHHVPMLLARRARDPMYDSAWDRLRRGIDDFGANSGLFQSLDVSKLGASDSGPFQIKVETHPGQFFNLTDVGYGVSQALPVLVDALSHPNQMVLLQQPEVHLHPRAQASLGSVLANQASEHRAAPIVVETHSDYLLDRIRLEVREGRKLSCKDLCIIYFERTDTGTTVWPIAVDSAGNLLDAPPSYRSFFLEEDRRLFFD